jgi:micrococcal nuclease
VVDGDTFVLAGGERVRLIGIDTPETVHPHKPIEHLGPEASEFAKRLLSGQMVRLEFDVQERDRYGRLLAYVYLEDGTFVNAEILRQGYGVLLTVPPNVKFAEEFLEIQRQAREAGRGLWKGEREDD